MSTYKTGTFVSSKGHPASGLHYTTEQWKALEKLTVASPREYRFGKPELVNGVLRPDGSFVQGADHIATILDAALSQSGAKHDEIRDAIEQARFFFVVDEDGFPHIQFQCAVDTNPEWAAEHAPVA